ncbi:hypothetical protein LIER_39440 [Lithospermum erythrorhizon]|uniref:Uncharacterized protein n=1 Tax=Lithospermum erythrorhizon TaxID=34254 RepID=A0AAV3QIY4_LITER
MEQGTTSHPGVTPRQGVGQYPKHLWVLCLKTSSGPSQKSRTTSRGRGKALEQHSFQIPREKDTHQLAPFAGNPLIKNPNSDHEVHSQQSQGRPTHKSKSYVEEISSGEYYPSREHRQENRGSPVYSKRGYT